MIYKVKVNERIQYSFEVEADSQVAAEMIAEEMAANKDTEFEDEYIDRDIQVSIFSDSGFDVCDDGIGIF